MLDQQPAGLYCGLQAAVFDKKTTCMPLTCMLLYVLVCADPALLLSHYYCMRCLQVFTVEMHHKRVDKAGPGDNVGMNIKGLDKGNMPRTGDVMILKSDQTLKPVKDFTAQVHLCFLLYICYWLRYD